MVINLKNYVGHRRVKGNATTYLNLIQKNNTYSSSHGITNTTHHLSAIHSEYIHMKCPMNVKLEL